MKMTSWRIRLYWADSRGSFEGGADAALPATMSAIEAIQEVARWREIDLAVCTSVEARRGDPSSDWENDK